MSKCNKIKGYIFYVRLLLNTLLFHLILTTPEDLVLLSDIQMKKFRHIVFRSHLHNVTAQVEVARTYIVMVSLTPLPYIDYFVLHSEIRLLSPVLYKFS